MPIYEYKCLQCSKKITAIQSIHEERLTICECGGELTKLVSLCSQDVVYRNSKEMLEKKIKPEAKKIADKIKNGDENEAANFFGDK